MPGILLFLFVGESTTDHRGRGMESFLLLAIAIFAKDCFNLEVWIYFMHICRIHLDRFGFGKSNPNLPCSTSCFGGFLNPIDGCLRNTFKWSSVITPRVKQGMFFMSSPYEFSSSFHFGSVFLKRLKLETNLETWNSNLEHWNLIKSTNKISSADIKQKNGLLLGEWLWPSPLAGFGFGLPLPGQNADDVDDWKKCLDMPGYNYSTLFNYSILLRIRFSPVMDLIKIRINFDFSIDELTPWCNLTRFSFRII